MTIEVEGATQPEGWVLASEIHLQNFSFIGTVESISEIAWQIVGREVLIPEAEPRHPGSPGDPLFVQPHSSSCAAAEVLGSA